MRVHFSLVIGTMFPGQTRGWIGIWEVFQVREIMPRRDKVFLSDKIERKI